MHRKQNIYVGAGVMLLSTVCYLAMNSGVKILAAQGYNTLEILFYSMCFIMPIFFSLAKIQGLQLRLNNTKVFILRVILGITCLACLFLSLRTISVSHYTLISAQQPILIGVMAKVFLGERLTLQGLFAATLTVMAIYLIISPNLGGSHINIVGVSLCLVGTLLAAGAHTCLRKTISTDSPITLSMWYAIISSVIIIMASVYCSKFRYLPTITYQSDTLWGVLLVVLGNAGAQLFQAQAYKYGEAFSLSMVTYMGLPLSILIDFLIFAQPIHEIFYIASLMIVIAAYILFRDQKIASQPILETT